MAESLPAERLKSFCAVISKSSFPVASSNMSSFAPAPPLEEPVLMVLLVLPPGNPFMGIFAALKKLRQ